MANRNWANGGNLRAMHKEIVLADCNFVVAVANGNGLTSLNTNGLFQAVYMHTSGAPSSGNPNPAAGTILVRMTDNYNKLLACYKSIVSPTSGAAVKIDNAALTAGVAYTITTLGNSTAAQWIAVGVPSGVTPAVGVTFIALTTGAGANTSTSRVMTTAATGSGVASIELVGDASADISPSPSANQGYGAQFILQCRDYAGALVAPADGTLISLNFYLLNSSVIVAGG